MAVVEVYGGWGAKARACVGIIRARAVYNGRWLAGGVDGHVRPFVERGV